MYYDNITAKEVGCYAIEKDVSNCEHSVRMYSTAESGVYGNIPESLYSAQYEAGKVVCNE